MNDLEEKMNGMIYIECFKITKKLYTMTKIYMYDKQLYR